MASRDNKDIRNEKNAVTLEEEAETLVSLFFLQNIRIL